MVYNESFTTGVETDRHGERLTNHKVFLSVGHDEYGPAHSEQTLSLPATRV